MSKDTKALSDPSMASVLKEAKEAVKQPAAQAQPAQGPALTPQGIASLIGNLNTMNPSQLANTLGSVGSAIGADQVYSNPWNQFDGLQPPGPFNPFNDISKKKGRTV